MRGRSGLVSNESADTTDREHPRLQYAEKMEGRLVTIAQVGSIIRERKEVRCGRKGRRVSEIEMSLRDLN
jgi:hypothetical protein